MEPIIIPLESRLKIQIFARKVDALTLEESHKLLIELYTDTIVKDCLYKELLKKRWGLDDFVPSQPYEFDCSPDNKTKET